MASAKTLEDLFLHTLQDIYHGEKQITKALPKMAKAATSPKLTEALQTHLRETEGQIERLEKVFQLMDERPKGKTCEAIKGLIKEGEEVIDDTGSGDVCDAGLIAAGQAVEHYAIARYGTLIAWAKQLGMSQAAQLLEQNLQEEKHADKLLNTIALESVNRKAA
jgi:ferritin-like metal-binding protein YciE